MIGVGLPYLLRICTLNALLFYISSFSQRKNVVWKVHRFIFATGIDSTTRTGTSLLSSSETSPLDKGYFKLPNDIDEELKLEVASEGNVVFPLPDETKQKILKEMEGAFDNLQQWEVRSMLESLCDSKDSYTCAKLIELTTMMDEIYTELDRRNNSNVMSDVEDLGDAARVTRSRIRMLLNPLASKFTPGVAFKWPW